MSTSKKNNFKILVTGGSGRFARALKKNTGKYNMIKDNNLAKIIKNNQLNDSFLSAKIDNIDFDCNILKGNFFSDTYSYFPITENFDSFNDLYQWQSPANTKFFFTKSFYDDFNKNLTNYKIIEDVYLLGSSFLRGKILYQFII